MLNFLAAIGSAPGGGGGSFESIATATGTGSSGTITFSSIPSTYQHLQIRIFGKSTNTSATVGGPLIRFNGATTGYYNHYIRGNGSSASAGGYSDTSISSGFAIVYSGTGQTNVYGAGIVDIHDYASTTKNKTVRMLSGGDWNGSGTIGLSSGLWSSTNAITSIDLITDNNFTTATTIALYGIKGA